MSGVDGLGEPEASRGGMALRGIALRGNDWSPLDGREPAEPPMVSVVIAHYDQQAELDRTLAALRRQTHPAHRTELIVVDDGSPTAPKVPPGVLLLRQDDHGFRLAAARNLGAGAASGDILCFLDADTVPEPAYLRSLTRMPALSPDVLTVGRRRHAALADLPVNAPVEDVAPAHELPSPEWLQRAYSDTRNLLDSDDRSYRYLIGAVLACSRALFDRAGGFDESFTEYGGEDWEWAHRAWLAGAVFAHVPEAVAWHDGPEWAGRDDIDARRHAKNAETLALARRIPVAGSRPFALRLGADAVAPVAPASAHAPADIVVHLRSADSLAALVISVDTVLSALPGARVTVPPEFLGAVAQDDRLLHPADAPPSRLVVEVPAAVRFAPGELERAVDRVTAEGLGSLELVAASSGSTGTGTTTGVATGIATGDTGRIALVSSRRALARAAFWQRDDLFDHVVARSESRRLAGEPDLAAYFGGWG